VTTTTGREGALPVHLVARVRRQRLPRLLTTPRHTPRRPLYLPSLNPTLSLSLSRTLAHALSLSLSLSLPRSSARLHTDEAASWYHACPIYHTVDYDPSIKSQLASSN